MYIGTSGACPLLAFFFFNDTATTEIYTLSLHDALPIYHADLDAAAELARPIAVACEAGHAVAELMVDRKSTRLNSSHLVMSYAVFCLKKKTEAHSVRRSAHPAQSRGTTGLRFVVPEGST